mmetsp:Transcript_47220/g.145641  ORF Transcript_47220/g.145641 Transcript_47220/m.145641 type:complete len:201 (-) Transcript_47220:212-814(-)
MASRIGIDCAASACVRPSLPSHSSHTYPSAVSAVSIHCGFAVPTALHSCGMRSCHSPAGISIRAKLAMTSDTMRATSGVESSDCIISCFTYVRVSAWRARHLASSSLRRPSSRASKATEFLSTTPAIWRDASGFDPSRISFTSATRKPPRSLSRAPLTVCSAGPRTDGSIDPRSTMICEMSPIALLVRGRGGTRFYGRIQ